MEAQFKTLFAFQDKIKILVVADVDVQSTYLLSEKFVPQEPLFDCVLCCGPFQQCEQSSPQSPEAEAVYLGDIAASLAALENIVCRVIYLPSEFEPVACLTEQMHLTPNSVNIYCRRLALKEKLFITGYTEVSDSAAACESISEDFPEEQAICNRAARDIQKLLGTGSKIVKEAIEVSLSCSQEEVVATSEQSLCTSTGIFFLKYLHSHTLNQFFFHLPEALAEAGVSICIIPECDANSREVRNLPPKLSGLDVVVVRSLRSQLKYTVVELALRDNKWILVHSHEESM